MKESLLASGSITAMVRLIHSEMHNCVFGQIDLNAVTEG